MHRKGIFATKQIEYGAIIEIYQVILINYNGTPGDLSKIWFEKPEPCVWTQ